MSTNRPGEYLVPLLQILAESLNVREIFERMSREIHRIVPHDYLMLGLLSDDMRRVHPVALSGDIPPYPNGIELTDRMLAAIRRGPYLMHEIQMIPGGKLIAARVRFEDSSDFEPFEVENQPLFENLAQRGIRSNVRVPIHLRGGLLGGLVFCSRATNDYTMDDLVRAKHIASCVALALAHQKLAEEEQKNVEERARSARLEVRVRSLTDQLEEASGRHRVIGQSKQWQAVLDHARKVAPTEATVLLSGESGTGKEVAARFIHRNSPRADGPFVALNCAALPEHLLESELFGHEKGAFTGAMTAHAGRIEQAGAGVLFLDEVGEMSSAVQAKFLRVLQEREYQRVGGARTLSANIRVLAATNRDLKTAVAEGKFRDDLYYRLAVFDILLPPLRERPDDLPILVDAFLDEIGRSVGRPAKGIAADARAHLAAYPWPGNVRELRNALERAVILCGGGTIESEHLPLGITGRVTGAATVAASPKPARGALDSAERQMIVDALAKAGHNKSKAARALGLTRAQLRSRIEKHGIPSESD